MRALVLVAISGLCLAVTDAQAIVVKDKKRQKGTVHDKPAVSSTVYSKSTYNKASRDRYSFEMRTPQRAEFKSAPKKQRKRSHIREWP